MKWHEDPLKEQMQIMIDNLPFPAWFKDAEGRYTIINRTFEMETGFLEEEVLGKKDYEFLGKREADIYTSSDLDVITGKKQGYYEAEYKPGQFKEEFKKAIFDESAKLLGTTGFSRDITERKLAEAELIVSEARFRTMFEEAPLGMAIYDSLSGRAYQINNRFAAIVGRTVDFMLENDWMSISHPVEIKENLYNLGLLSKGKIHGFDMNKRYIRPDGSIVWAHMTIVPFNSGAHESPRHLCMLEDITSSKKKEEEILYLSYHDILTGLYNRAYFEEEGRRLNNTRRIPLSVIMADMNGLKFINDALGHSVGDRMLIKIGEILKNACRNEDVVARVGGDEFCILLPQTSAKEAQIICRRIYKACKNYSNNKDNQPYHLSISLGYATKYLSTESLENLLREAEDMMYVRKILKRKSVHSAILSSIKAATLEKSHETKGHAERLSELSSAIGIELKLKKKELGQLRLLAVMHDIGKVNISDEILIKPGKLTEEEWREVKKHPESGYRIAQASTELKPIGDYILAHHERFDGKGYPKGLAGQDIPLLARIISVVDAYDVMTQVKPYGEEKTKAEAISEMRANSGTQFDPAILDIFLNKVLR